MFDIYWLLWKKNDDFIQARHSHYSKQSSIQNKLDAFSFIFAYSCTYNCIPTDICVERCMAYSCWGRSREVTSILLFIFIITYQMSSASLFWYKKISEMITYLFRSCFVYYILMFPGTMFLFPIQGVCWSKLYVVTYVYPLSFI